MADKKSVGESQEARIAWSVETRHCAFCGVDMKDMKIVGSGSFSDGIFCSLDCYTRFHTTGKYLSLRGETPVH